MNLLPILFLLPFTLAADQITINITKMSGSIVLTLQEPICVSALRDRILAEDSGLRRPGIKLIRDNLVLQDTDEITESANVVLVTSELKRIPNRAENAMAFLLFGKVRCNGNKDYGGRTPKGLQDVNKVVATYGSFVALKSDGSVIAWGDEGSGGRAPEGLEEDVEEVVSTERAFAALKSDGSVIAWGNEDFGGRAPEGIEDVKEVVTTYGAFVSLKSDGSVKKH